MMAATVGMAIGQNSDVTAEAAGVVVMESSLKKVHEFMHISRRMRTIALQSGDSRPLGRSSKLHEKRPATF